MYIIANPAVYTLTRLTRDSSSSDIKFYNYFDGLLSAEMNKLNPIAAGRHERVANDYFYNKNAYAYLVSVGEEYISLIEFNISFGFWLSRTSNFGTFI